MNKNKNSVYISWGQSFVFFFLKHLILLFNKDVLNW